MPPSLKLVLEKGPRSGGTLDFPATSATTVRIGRLVRGNDLAIKDPGISSKHLKIEFCSDSVKWVLTDLESSNGTILNSVRLEPNNPYPLADGDEIKIGELTAIRVGLDQIGPELGRPSNPRKQQRETLEENPNLGKGRRSPRRQPPTKGETLEENPNLEALESGVDLGKENWKGRRNPRRQPPATKGEALETLEENPDLEEVDLWKENRKGRGRGRLKKDAENNVDRIVENVKGKEVNVGMRRTRNSKRDGEELVSLVDPVATRRTRSGKNLQKNEDLDVGNAKQVEKKQQSEDLDVGDLKGMENVGVVESIKKGRGRGRKKKVVEVDKPQDSTDILEEVLEPKNQGEESMGDVVGQFAMEDETTERPMEENVVGGPNEEEQETVGVDEKEEEQESDQGPDLEKMTLGEWFDYLEVYLPKQIRAARDQVIEDMRKRAEQYEEFVSQQLNNKQG